MASMPDAPAFNPLQHPLALTDPLQISEDSAWITHIPFAMALIDILKPRTLVELGTFKGDSYCAFCQAVLAAATGTQCFAIDTWQGDAHAGPIHQQVLQNLRAHHDPLYGSFSTLIQSEFDAAAPRFADGSIDLLHIDGLHLYEAAKHDFEHWLPKLSDRAVVLFHDTQVRERNFGVWRFWAELSANRPNFEFTHGFGLGVLGVGANLPQPFRDFLDAANATPDVVRKFFFIAGHRIELYRVAKLMIDGQMHNHQLIERWLHARGQGFNVPLPNPATQPDLFIKRMAAEVELLTSRSP
jgi:hypothetical protein